MTKAVAIPLGVKLTDDIEIRQGARPYRARVRWSDPVTGGRRSKSIAAATEDEALDWIASMHKAANGGIDPQAATMTLAEYGESIMALALRGLEEKTLDPYLAGWRKRVVPSLGHIQLRTLTNGTVDRAVHAWIADECGRSTVKNSLAVLKRVAEQAVRDGIIERNPANVSNWQREYQKAEDELDDPRSLALADWETLASLAKALTERSHGRFNGWADVVLFAACTAARIGEVSGVQAQDINRDTWMWTVRRQTTTGPRGLIDKGTKGKRARTVPIIEEIRDLVGRRLDAAAKPVARLFTGPRGGRITTAILRDATHWDEVVSSLGLEHLRRHDLRHTGLTWMADAGVPVHVLRKIAGHGSITTTQRYLHPDRRAYEEAGAALSAHLSAPGPKMVPTATQP